jgi:hypothetical protein
MGVKLGLTFIEVHRLKVFWNRVLRRIFEPKRDGIIRGQRKLRNKGIHILYYSPNEIIMEK